MKIKAFDNKAKEIKKEDFLGTQNKLSDALFFIINRVSNLARIKSANTKTRGQRRGGGIKPWRQKGTGRARVGSNRSPIWRKGGVIFGPKSEQNFSRKINKKSLKAARFNLLYQKAKMGEIFVLKIEAKNFSKKTKAAEKLILGLPLKEGRILFLKGEKENLRGLKNIAYLTIKRAKDISTSDLLKFNNFILTALGLKEIKGIYEKKD